MILKEKIVIDFKFFLLEGRFDVLKIGKSKEWIIHNFPNPDGFIKINDPIYRSNIWTYGNIELHFSDDILYLIFSDYIHELSGGEHLSLNKWFLGDPSNLKLATVLNHLNEAQMDYKKETMSAVAIVKIILKSGVQLDFALTEEEDEEYNQFIERTKHSNHNEFELRAFSLQE